MKVVHAKLTEKLVLEIEEPIKQGWYANKSELIKDAVRELVKKLKPEQLELAIKEDISWGLYDK